MGDDDSIRSSDENFQILEARRATADPLPIRVENSQSLELAMLEDQSAHDRQFLWQNATVQQNGNALATNLLTGGGNREAIALPSTEGGDREASNPPSPSTGGGNIKAIHPPPSSPHRGGAYDSAPRISPCSRDSSHAASTRPFPCSAIPPLRQYNAERAEERERQGNSDAMRAALHTVGDFLTNPYEVATTLAEAAVNSANETEERLNELYYNQGINAGMTEEQATDYVVLQMQNRSIAGGMD